LRLDGSSAEKYSLELLSSCDPGFFKSFFTTALVEQPHAKLIFFLYLAGMITISTFGLWIFACIAGVVFMRSKTQAAVLCFPLVVAVNYIVMSVGLAMDEKKIGTPDELLQRPFVWAYFVVVASTAGGCYAFFFGDRAPASAGARILIAVVLFGCLTVPIRFAHNLQTMPVWQPFADFKTFNAVPSDLVKASHYIRKHSRAGDIIQDSENDPKLVLGGLAERQDFAVEYVFDGAQPPVGLRERLNELAAFKQMRDASGVIQYAKVHKISWYVLQPVTKVTWPAEIFDAPVFESGGYRVYHFAP